MSENEMPRGNQKTTNHEEFGKNLKTKLTALRACAPVKLRFLSISVQTHVIILKLGCMVHHQSPNAKSKSLL